MTFTDGPPVHLEVKAGIATIQLARPPMNPFDDAMRDSLIDAVRTVADDVEVRVCVVHGGTENFAAGADIKALVVMGFEDIVDWNARLHSAFSSVAALPMPVIAAINGYALGGGLELALAADFRVGSATCIVGLPEIKLGILPGSGGTQRLTQIIGRSQAKLLMMSGKHVRAQQAHRLGIIDEIVPANETIARAQALARELASAPRHAIQAIKACVDAALPLSEAALALERASLAGMFATEDRNTAMATFLEGGRRG